MNVEQNISDKLESLIQETIVDSVTVSVFKTTIYHSCTAFWKNFETAPDKDYSSNNRFCFICYKMYLVFFDNCMFQKSLVTKVNVHEINNLRSMNHLISGKQLLGDRTCRLNQSKMCLFE
jgi:hypothetical protein